PEAIVIQCGADALDEDPLSDLGLSNNALWRVVGGLMGEAKRLLVLGGGGYNPWAVARCWAGVWGTLNRLPMPAQLPDAAGAGRGAPFWTGRRSEARPEHWFTTLADPPRPGPVRDAVRRVAAAALDERVAA